MRLNEFQDQFSDLMLDAPDALESVPESFAALFESGDIGLSERLKVYRSNIVGGVAENLCKSFPLIQKLVGDDFLRDMARRFVMAHPPQTGCLNFYGRGFDEFIRTYEPAKNLPYLPDIAALEIAMNDAYYARDDEGMSAQYLAVIAPEELGDLPLSLRSSAYLISSSYALDDLRAFCLSPEGKPPSLEKDTYLMVYRPKLDVEIVSLNLEEHKFLAFIKDGFTLGQAAAAVLEQFPSFDIQNFLQKHLTLETFCALPPNGT